MILNYSTNRVIKPFKCLTPYTHKRHNSIERDSTIPPPLMFPKEKVVESEVNISKKIRRYIFNMYEIEFVLVLQFHSYLFMSSLHCRKAFFNLYFHCLFSYLTKTMRNQLIVNTELY